VRESKTENGKVVADPTAFTAVKVKHSGEEEGFTDPTKAEPAAFLAKAAEAFFGRKDDKPELLAPLVLAFDPVGARDEVKKDSTSTGVSKRKTVDQLVDEVKALPAHSSKTKSVLKKLGKDGLEKLLAEAQQATPEAPAAAEGAPTEDAGTES
jgi:hypothetical protein